ncbi:MAG TPA: TolC family protein [Polyangia bacterium]|nr:TolC family protein [Polyangia bacterium]
MIGLRRQTALASLIGLLAFGVAPPWAQAAEAEAPAARAAFGATSGGSAATPLTLEQALAMGRKRSRSLIVERARLAQAQTSIEQAWAALFPTVTAQGKYTHNDTKARLLLPVTDMMGQPTGMTRELTLQPQEQLDAVINANVPLIAPPAYPALQAVKSSVRAADANFEVSETQVLFSVAQAFYAAAISDEVLVTRHSSVGVARATLDNARTRFAAGTVTKVDVDRAEIALIRAEQQEREARTAREQTYRGLATLIQIEGTFQVMAPPAAATPAADTGTLEMALQLRPEFRAVNASLESADSQRSAYAWRWAPTVSAFGQARRFNYLNFAQHNYAWSVGAQLDWVIFDGGTRDSQRHLAAAQADEALARTEVLRDSIRDDLANGRANLETKRRAAETAERSVGLARETLELVRTQYEAGTVTQVDLLQAQDGLVAVQESLAQAHFDVAIADLTLRRAAGTFPGK